MIRSISKLMATLTSNDFLFEGCEALRKCITKGQIRLHVFVAKCTYILNSSWGTGLSQEVQICIYSSIQTCICTDSVKCTSPLKSGGGNFLSRYMFLVHRSNILFTKHRLFAGQVRSSSPLRTSRSGSESCTSVIEHICMLGHEHHV